MQWKPGKWCLQKILTGRYIREKIERENDIDPHPLNKRVRSPKKVMATDTADQRFCQLKFKLTKYTIMITKLKFIMTGLILSTAGFSQSLDSVLVKGQVVSRENNPLQGVTIRISNSDKTVLSDVYGQFELWTPVEGILEFSCISEPYKVSLSSVGLPEENELIIFKFDVREASSNYWSKRLKGRTIKVNKVRQGRFSDIALAHYNSDFERITNKYYDYHYHQDHKIFFLIDGQFMEEEFTPADLNYSSLENITIIRIIDSYEKIIFLVTTRGK